MADIQKLVTEMQSALDSSKKKNEELGYAKSEVARLQNEHSVEVAKAQKLRSQIDEALNEQLQAAGVDQQRGRVS